MGRQMNKRKRIFSLEPNKDSSAKRYLVSSSSELENVPISASPAQELARTLFLRQKLRGQDYSKAFSLKHNETLVRRGGEAVTLDTSGERKEKNEGEEEEEDEIDSKLGELRRLLPGGEEDDEMGVEELLSGVGSYIASLELQMFVLKCLVQET